MELLATSCKVLLLLIVLFAIAFADETSTSLFQAALAKVAGVYRSPSTRRLDKTIVMTMANYGYKDILSNFYCYLDRLDIKALVISLDSSIHEHIKANMPNLHSVLWLGAETVSEKAASFRTHQFHVITNYKFEVVLQVLKENYDIIFLDADIILMKDPVPLLLQRNVDYVHSVNQPCLREKTSWSFQDPKYEGNTGLYFVRRNLRTKLLWSLAVEYSKKFKNLDDQSIFWKLLRNCQKTIITPLGLCKDKDVEMVMNVHNDLNTNINITTCHLDHCMFSVGSLRGRAFNTLQSYLQETNQTLYTIHANYLANTDAKKAAMKAHRFWIVNSDGKCLDSQGNISQQ